ncbi:MAG: hypothetical protein NDI88_10180 [Lysobacter sp.]|nr:hypothetical protein [Lysobacter sp.]
MGREGAVSNRLARHGAGCAVYFVLFAGLAWGIDRFLGTQVAAEARPWVGIAASVFFTIGLGSVWGIVSGYAVGDPKAGLAAGAAGAGFPGEDAPMLATGTVRPAGSALRAPISGIECVAYMYRMYYLTTNYDVVTTGGVNRPKIEVPVYWGQACRPFVVDSSKRVVRVLAVPRLVDAPLRREGESDIERARQWVGATRFERASGLAGALGTALAMADDILTDDDAECRRDWMSEGEARDPATLILEETVLPVGASASLVGPWSASRRAIVPHVAAAETLGASVTTDPADALLASYAGLPPSRLAAALFALVTLAIGAAIVWGAMSLAS